MVSAFKAVQGVQEKYNTTMRTAAYAVASKRIIDKMK
jgi:glutamate dehydrogenase/leucine dehydrogenase